MKTHLSSQILHLNPSALQRHHQAALQLILRPRELTLRNRRIQQQTQLMDQMGQHLTRRVPLVPRHLRQKRHKQPEQRAIRVYMVERRAMVDVGVVVEDVRVQTAVHALAGTPSGEGASAPEEDLHGREGVDVVVVDADAFVSEVEVVEFGGGVFDEAVSAGVG